MDPMKLPDKEAKSLSFLAYSLACLISSTFTSDSTARMIFWVFAAISFVLAAAKFIKTDLFFPLIPCKNRIKEKGKFICNRDKGFCLGFFISILAIIIIKKYQIEFPLQDHSLLIGIICIMLSVVHGILRRCFGILSSDNFSNNLLTFILGFITGIGTLFIAIYFIHF